MAVTVVRKGAPNEERIEDVWLVVTVNKRTSSYRLLMNKPRSMAVNEFAYNLRITLHMADWFDRIQEIKLPEVKPPKWGTLALMSTSVTKDTATQVFERMKGGTDV